MKNTILKLISAITALAAGVMHLPAANIPNSRYGGKFDPTPVKMPRKYAAPANELRGVWVATIFNLDYPRPTDVQAFKKFYSNMCRNLANHKFNAIFFQVRPSNDAFYPSKYNPWSRFLSGTEGVPLAGSRNFDPLAFMIAEAHKHGLQFHAWLNPYRVIGSTPLSKQRYLNTLSPKNFARRHPGWVVEKKLNNGQRALVLNPGEPAVRNFVAATVMEIVQRYNVDSIHFDDYFYPDDLPAAADLATYRKYNPAKLPLDAWRRQNVTKLISSINEQIKRYNRQSRRRVRFGVSPFGIWQNRKNHPAGSLTAGRESFNTQYADTRLWVKNRLIDYIVPQIYWTFNHDTAPYAALTDWWSQTVNGTGVDLYIGQAAYQLGTAQWQENELYYQLLYNRSRSNIKGSIIFSYRNLAAPDNKAMERGARNMLKKFWQ